MSHLSVVVCFVLASLLFESCRCSSSDKNSTSSGSDGASKEQSDQSASGTNSAPAEVPEFNINSPEASVAAPNVRLAWSAEGHPAGTVYSYVIGKGKECAESVYQGEDLAVTGFIVKLTPGEYSACVTAKSGGASRQAANQPWTFKVTK